ncbi:MAG TPA: hypothetical protein VGZ02_10540 [Candidatus Baltobacteraceae bacterium]|nr:hypothetical protein [Candidatus Baltobacteraceae bacterium]
MNSLRHGLFSQAIVIDGVEDPSEFETLMRDVLAADPTDDPVVRLSAERFVAIAWRLRRCHRVETQHLNLRAREHTARVTELQKLREEANLLTVYSAAISAIRYGRGAVEAATLERAREAVQYLFDSALSTRLEFDSEALAALEARKRPIRRKTAIAALQAAWKTLPPELGRDSFEAFTWALVDALAKREAAQQKAIEVAELAAARALVDAQIVPWGDARTVADVEARLDRQFSRALSDYHEARRAALAASIPSPIPRAGHPA